MKEGDSHERLERDKAVIVWEKLKRCLKRKDCFCVRGKKATQSTCRSTAIPEIWARILGTFSLKFLNDSNMETVARMIEDGGFLRMFADY